MFVYLIQQDTFFPAMRLLLPQLDRDREAYGIKEVSELGSLFCLRFLVSYNLHIYICIHIMTVNEHLKHLINLLIMMHTILIKLVKLPVLSKKFKSVKFLESTCIKVTQTVNFIMKS